MKKKIKIGALISGGGTNLQAIIDACESNRIDGEMVFVGSDVLGAGGLERSRRHGIPHFVVDYGAIIRNFRQHPESVLLPPDFKMAEAVSRQSLFRPDAPAKTIEFFLATRAIAEAALLKSMAAYSYDLLVLAGFMRNLTPYFIDRVNHQGEPPRIMNIHPALLPSFPGTDGYGDTFRHGCKIGGCTVHFIDYGEDSGPIIGQRAFPIEPEDTLDTIRKKGLQEEWILYPECIQLFAEKRLAIFIQEFTGSAGVLISRRTVRVLPPKPVI
ncbi:MAG: phosphoribosylglycinamide formyltransferase [Pseudomonadota bacterium]